MTELERLHFVDTLLLKLSKQLHLMKYLFPTNVSEERARFIEHDGLYDPQFTYNLPEKKLLKDIREQLLSLQKEYFSNYTYTLGIAHLLEEKIQENIWKAEMLLAYHDQDFDRIAHFMKLLFGEFDTDILAYARYLLPHYHAPSPILRGELLTGESLLHKIQEHIADRDYDISVLPNPTSPSKFSLRFSSHGTRLMYYPQIKVRTHDLEADMIHELDVHYARYYVGKSTGWNILTYGTSGYTTIEEGIAIYQVVQYKRKYYPAFEKIGIYQKYIFLHDTIAKSGKDITEYLRVHKIAKSPEAIFDLLLRSKLGVQDCSLRHPGTTFLHMKLYADGYHQICQWIDTGHSITELFVGKIHINDLPYLTG